MNNIRTLMKIRVSSDNEDLKNSATKFDDGTHSFVLENDNYEEMIYKVAINGIASVLKEKNKNNHKGFIEELKDFDNDFKSFLKTIKNK